MLQLLPGISLDNTNMVYLSDRFAEAFGQAWGAIPTDDGRIVLGYLHHYPARVVLCFRMDQRRGLRDRT